MVDGPALLTAKEAAALLRVTVQSIYRWGEDGTLPVVKIAGTRRYPADALERILRGEVPEPTEAAS